MISLPVSHDYGGAGEHKHGLAQGKDDVLMTAGTAHTHTVQVQGGDKEQIRFGLKRVAGNLGTPESSPARYDAPEQCSEHQPN